ncbi:hypothetical protein [Micromonospora sp. NPDC050276]|uniref:hypothetical protein n=1 Tax=Micromonospora sp. NPDC050276 TaxID=3364278 RepID=UPI0037B63754
MATPTRSAPPRRRPAPPPYGRTWRSWVSWSQRWSRTAEAARGRAEAALAGWRTALREQSERATDPQLKTLLTDLGTEVSALGADVEAIDETELDRLQQRLDQLCAR